MNNENNIVNLKDQETNQIQDENLKPSTRRLTGKVAALPKHLRDVVNSMLDDGHGYETIVAKLDQLGHPGFLTQNISRWKLNGYQQYLRRQEHLDEIKLRSESALDFLHHFVPFVPSVPSNIELRRTRTNAHERLRPITNFQFSIFKFQFT